jgi:hypothetical protein
VKHIPWSVENYTKQLALCDIGIAPNNLIHKKSEKAEMKCDREYNYSEDDYSLRFKMPSNPGRIIVFGKLNIPVVADFYPSAIQCLSSGVGLLANSSAGWEHCLERLITSSELRQTMGDKAQELVRGKFDYEKQNVHFSEFMANVLAGTL